MNGLAGPATSDGAGPRLPVALAGARLGFLVQQFPVVSETFVVELGSALVEAGCDLRILATRDADPTAMQRFPGAARLPLIAPVPNGSLGRALLAQPRLAPRFATTLFLPRGERAETLRTAAAFARADPFDLLHCQFGTLGLAALRHARLRSLRYRRLVVHLRGYDITKFVAERGPDIYRDLFAKADHFIANCEHFRQRAIALGCAPDRVTVIGSPVDTDRFAPPAAPRAISRDRPFRIAAIGRLVEKKGFADLVRAVAMLSDRGACVELDILGDGPLRGDLDALVASLRAGGVVHLRGPASQAEVLALLHRADLLVAPSVRAASGDEDAPVNTLKEALATELPVVATRHGGIPELVEDGVNGLLVPERDLEALSLAIARMIAADANLRAAYGRAGRKKVVVEYGRDIVTRRTMDLYATLL